jgi:hypothetical protein
MKLPQAASIARQGEPLLPIFVVGKLRFSGEPFGTTKKARGEQAIDRSQRSNEIKHTAYGDYIDLSKYRLELKALKKKSIALTKSNRRLRLESKAIVARSKVLRKRTVKSRRNSN